MCNSSNPTTAYILKGCQEALNQGQFTWYHDSVLNDLTSLIRQVISPSGKLFINLPGLRANDLPTATIPTNISTTTARPDLVLVSESSISMLELTVPTKSHQAIQAARGRKMNQPNYEQLIGNLENRGLNVSFRSVEIGSLGHYERHAIHCICHTFNLPKCDASQILLKLARTSVSCSYHISTAETLRAGTQTSLFTVFEILSFLKL